MKSCTEHHSLQLMYEYDNEKKVIITKENLRLTSNDCLCENYRARMILSEEFSVPDIESPGRTYQFDIDADGFTIAETAQYHIITLKMLSKFFELWMSNDSNSSRSDYNRCVLTLLGHIKRSIQKILIVSTISSAGRSHEILDRMSTDTNHPFFWTNQF